MALDPWLGPRQAFCTFYLTVAAAAWAGGLRPGLVALGLSALAGIWFFVEPRDSLRIGTSADAASLVIFLAVGLAVLLLIRRTGAAEAEAARLDGARRQAELDLRQSESLTRRIIDAVPALISYVGADLRYRVVNRTYEQWFGRPAADLAGQHVREVLGEAVFAHVRSHLDQALAGREVTFEPDLPFEVKGPRSVRIAYAPDRGPDGRVRGIVVLVNDVTDRKRADEAVRQSEARSRALMEQSPLSTQVFAPDGRTVRVNRAWEELWGVTLDQVADYNVLHDPQLEAKGIAPYVRKGFAGEATAIPAIEYDPNETIPDRTRHKDPKRWVRAFIYPLRDDQGQISEVVLIHEDITGQKRAEAELQGAHDRLSFALDASRMGDWSWDTATDEVRLSDRAAELFAIPARPARTRAEMRELLHPDDRPRVARELDRVIAERADYDLEYRVRTPGGGWRWVAAKGRAVYDAHGQVTGMSGVMLDVTDRKRLEEELQRTVDALRDADRLKDEFLAMLAHELRNPLAPIRNALHVLKKPAADDAIRDQVRATAERQVGHMARLLDDLLDVSRISRGKIQLRTEPVDLAAVAARTAEVARPAIEERRHTLTVSVPPAGAWVSGDATRLEQVVTNLLTNATKYTDPGGRIALAVEVSGGDAILRVADTGIGIAADMLARVFDLFVQAERRLDRAQGGVGIGLTLVKRLVELHGGSVEARSEGLGKGSEFLVRLPLLPRRDEGRGMRDEIGACLPSSLIPLPSSLREIPPPSSLPRRVLVVDDNRDAADSLALVLRMDGHDVAVAYDGPSALALTPEFRPEFVFLDLGMPGLDGYEVCRRLRRMPELVGARVVAVTGWGQDADRRRSSEAGFDHHLVKPADPDVIRRLF